MNVSYITHSCFLVELDSCHPLFDYYRGTLSRVKEDKPLYVLASHAHTDHYSTRIFKPKHPSIIWILPNGIAAAHPYIQMKVGKCYTVNDLQVRTLASTDEGVAFLVTTEDNYVYHAGDLNWWDWGDENTPQEHAEMEERYFRGLQSIKGMYFDVAFLPVDPRLRERALEGARALLQYASCDLLVPIHFWKGTAAFTQLRHSEVQSIEAMQFWLGFRELETLTKVQGFLTLLWKSFLKYATTVLYKQ